MHFVISNSNLKYLSIYLESIRVAKFRKLANNNGSISELGKLMRESHTSLQELYECSHEQLNELVEISDHLGTPARLTGAGLVFYVYVFLNLH